MSEKCHKQTRAASGQRPPTHGFLRNAPVCGGWSSMPVAKGATAVTDRSPTCIVADSAGIRGEKVAGRNPPCIVAGRVGINPTLTAHTSLVCRCRRNTFRIAATRHVGGTQLRISRSGMDCRPMCRICLRSTANQHSDANNKKSSHGLSFPVHAHMWRQEQSGSEMSNYKLEGNICQ